MGNHELWMHKCLSTGEFDDFALHGFMGGQKTLTSYGISTTGTSEDISKRIQDKIPDAHKEFFLGLPLTRVLEIGGATYRLTHGGIPRLAGKRAEDVVADLISKLGSPYSPQDLADAALKFLEGSSPEIFLWGGAKKTNVYAFPDGSYQVFGHTPWAGGAEVSTKGKYIALDTGCGTCPPYKLSGVLLSPDGQMKLL
jgi:hypothetical protein